MNTATRENRLQQYQALVVRRALHPELFQLKGRRVVRHAGYELEGWIMPGKHLLRFEQGGLCCCELVTDEPIELPAGSLVERFYCAGERDFDVSFTEEPVEYIVTVQTEQLTDNLYASTLDEMRQHAAAEATLLHEWVDEAGQNLSMLDIQRFQNEVHVQAYHLLAAGGTVIRSQTIFEVRSSSPS